MSKINLANLLFLFCLFPYISPIATPFDMQPYALIFATFLLFLLFMVKGSLIIPQNIMIYFLILGYSLIVWLTRSGLSSGLRSVVGYASVAILSWAGYHTFKFVNGKKLLHVVNIWLLFGVIQTFFSKDFGSFLLPRLSTTADRGVTSLAVEPSSYAIMCVFFLVFNDIFYTRGDYEGKTYKYITFITIIQFILSKSALGFILLGIYFLAKVFSSGNSLKKTRNLTGLFLLGLLFYYLMTTVEFLQSGRIGSLIAKLEGGVINLVLKDASIADRLSHILVSIASLFHSYGMGYGLGTFDKYANYLAHNSGDFIRSVTSVNFTQGRIMSGWGTAIFELGIVGVAFLLLFVSIFRKGIRKNSGKFKNVYKSSFITIFFTMMMSVSLSFAPFGYLMGAMLYYVKGYNNEIEIKGQSFIGVGYDKLN